MKELKSTLKNMTEKRAEGNCLPPWQLGKCAMGNKILQDIIALHRTCFWYLAVHSLFYALFTMAHSFNDNS